MAAIERAELTRLATDTVAPLGLAILGILLLTVDGRSGITVGLFYGLAMLLVTAALGLWRVHRRP